MVKLTRPDVRRFRADAQQLTREACEPADTSVLDVGVQDTGPDGGLWALAVRGADISRLSEDELVLVWTLRGAPHLYRRANLPEVAAAVEPFSDADAGKRIYDASKPLKAAGISNLAALDAVAEVMASVVQEPLPKGEVSHRVANRMPAPYLRRCGPCKATHLYEMPFRLAALRAGLELLPGTSPPVLRPIPGFKPANKVPAQYDVVRAYLRLLGPATVKDVASFLDAPARDVRFRWPSDAVEVAVEGEARWLLAEDVERVAAATPTGVRLLGPYDLFLQAKDRSTLVDDPARAKALWPVLGRPGAVLVNGDIVGTWRPRKTASKLSLQVDLWESGAASARPAIEEQAERLSAYRRSRLGNVEFAA